MIKDNTSTVTKTVCVYFVLSFACVLVTMIILCSFSIIIPIFQPRVCPVSSIFQPRVCPVSSIFQPWVCPVSSIFQPRVCPVSSIFQPRVCPVSSIFQPRVCPVSSIFQPRVCPVSSIFQPWVCPVSSIFQPRVCPVSSIFQPRVCPVSSIFQPWVCPLAAPVTETSTSETCSDDTAAPTASKPAQWETDPTIYLLLLLTHQVCCEHFSVKVHFSLAHMVVISVYVNRYVPSETRLWRSTLMPFVVIDLGIFKGYCGTTELCLSLCV